MDNIEISTPKMSLINNIGNPHNYPRKYTLNIADSGVNIHISNESTPPMSPVIMSNNMTSIISYGSTIESSHEATLRLPGLTKTLENSYFTKNENIPTNIVGNPM